MTEATRPMAWDPTPAASWVEEINTWAWDAESHPLSSAVLGHVKYGLCPRCGHPMKVRKAGPGY